MIQYILEAIAFQLVFLIIYDFFLKRETFFQWNRLYLIGTYILSMVLPWVKIEALKTTVPEQYYVYPEFLWNADTVSTAVTASVAPIFTLSWEESIVYSGMVVAAFYFGNKLFQIYRLRKAGNVKRLPDFTQVIVKNSELAFSFFRSIFLGDKIISREHQNIIEHELVHIRQGHSWDLLFFEVMRIVGWFNPLVYVYQSRVSELHEFIADSKVAKTDKKEQYEFLLSQIFQTENISFVNQFFKSSLIKKRILMLQKSKSNRIWKLKYLALVPIVVGILMYTSSVGQEVTGKSTAIETQSDDAVLIEKVETKITQELAELGSLKKVSMSHRGRSHWAESQEPLVDKEAYFESAILFKMLMEEMTEKMEKTRAGGAQFAHASRIPLPSTERYERYVTRKEVFQILDKNLQFSVSMRDVPIEVLKIQNKANYPDSFDVYEVANVSDLAGDEVRKFNHIIDAIFTEDNSKFAGLILKDKNHSIQIFKGSPMVGINYWPKPSTTAKKNATKADSIIPFAIVEEVPLFPGCEDAADKRACFREKIQQHIAKNFTYPQEAQEKGIQGTVGILFTISETGAIDTIKTRGPHPLLEDEAKRIISLLPEMKPGKHKGELVNVPFSIPITFRLQPQETDLETPSDGQKSSKEEASINKEDHKEKINAFSYSPPTKFTLNPKEPEPLIILDGREASKETRNSFTSNDIESVNVLKGESAVNIYGEKGKNGVILIQTKKNGISAKEANEIYKTDTTTMAVKATAITEKGTKIISGTVTDGNMGLPGATISIQGSEKGVISDFDGNFEINVKKGDVIVFQYIGLPILKFTVTDENTYQITKKK